MGLKLGAFLGKGAWTLFIVLKPVNEGKLNGSLYEKTSELDKISNFVLQDSLASSWLKLRFRVFRIPNLYSKLSKITNVELGKILLKYNPNIDICISITYSSYYIQSLHFIT